MTYSTIARNRRIDDFLNHSSATVHPKFNLEVMYTGDY